MSLLVVNLVPQGIIFGADRNISNEKPGEPEHIDEVDGRSYYEVIHRHFNQATRPKVLRWPQRSPQTKALIGYVGEAEIGGLDTDEWLYDFIGDNLTFESFEKLAELLRQSVQEQYSIDMVQRHNYRGGDKLRPLIIHLGGFEMKEGIHVPAIWVIRNDHSPPHLKDIRKEFLAIECVWKHPAVTEKNITPKNIQTLLADRAKDHNPVWFHQGIDLDTFNLLEKFLKSALRELNLSRQVDQQCPQTLEDWKRQVRMAILMYGAYHQAYKEPHEQDVGGGADVISIPWPESLV
jgi:hypothetical protein